MAHVCARWVLCGLAFLGAADVQAVNGGGGAGGDDPPSQFVLKYYEDGQLIRAGESVPALGPNLMGDSVNEYSGTLSFTQTDTSLPGNNALSVAVGRHLDTGIKDPLLALGLFGDWELEIPHLHTLVTHAIALPGVARDWYGMDASGNYNQNRCSQIAGPPLGAAGVGGSRPVPVSANAWWSGYHMYLPGNGDQTLVGRNFLVGNFPTDPIQPTDGVAYPVLTNQRWQISCLPSLANGAGEGFVAVSPSGTRYRFDHIAVRAAYGPGFTGHVDDPGTGLIYMQQRYYDPIAGRFQSVDPVARSPPTRRPGLHSIATDTQATTQPVFDSDGRADKDAQTPPPRTAKLPLVSSSSSGTCAGAGNQLRRYGPALTLGRMTITASWAISAPPTWFRVGLGFLFYSGGLGAPACEMPGAIPCGSQPAKYAKPPADAYDRNGAQAPGKPGEQLGFENPKGGDK